MRRVTISEEIYRSLQVEGLVTGESPGEVLERLVGGGISLKAREILNTIGETSATEKRKIGNLEERPRGRLVDDPVALQSIRDLWQSGETNRAEIARIIGYPKAIVAENIKKMLEAGDLEEEKADEATS